MTNAFIFLNGDYSKSINIYKDLNIDENHIYCADGGAKQVLKLGYIPREVWGDFDSLDKNSLDKLKKLKVKLKMFNKYKDFTDGELLISYVSDLNYNNIYIFGGLGGRIDHTLTNINLIFKYNRLIFIDDVEELFLISSNYYLNNLVGKQISFIPYSDKVTNLTLDGFLYDIKNYLLIRGDTRCLSNIITNEKAYINFSSGKLLACISRNKIMTNS